MWCLSIAMTISFGSSICGAKGNPPPSRAIEGAGFTTLSYETLFGRCYTSWLIEQQCETNSAAPPSAKVAFAHCCSSSTEMCPRDCSWRNFSLFRLTTSSNVVGCWTGTVRYGCWADAHRPSATRRFRRPVVRWRQGRADRRRVPGAGGWACGEDRGGAAQDPMKRRDPAGTPAERLANTMACRSRNSPATPARQPKPDRTRGSRERWSAAP